MHLTRAADYAVRLMVHLAGRPPGSRQTLSEIAKAVDGPEQFLSKVLQQLVRAQLLASHRGGRGGFELALPPAEMSMLRVIEAIDGPTALNACLGSDGSCARHTWCAAHAVWTEAQDAMMRKLRGADLAYLAHESGVRRNFVQRHEIEVSVPLEG